MRDLTIAVIIPAYNEAENILPTIESIHTALDGFQYEVVVADNGSSDGTAKLAAATGAKLVVDPDRTVGGLRNLAARRVSADLLLFLDADVHLSSEWRAHFPLTAAELIADGAIVSGSSCDVPKDATWLERNWFRPLARRHKNYINSGHLIISSEFFDALGGFDETLRTGEDYDLCARAQRRGGSIRPNPSLLVHHHGFPRTIRAFIGREAWHGLGDFQSLRSIIGSRVAIAAILFGTLHMSLLVGLAVRDGRLVLASILATILLCFLVSYHMIGRASLHKVAAGSVVAYAYLLGRAAAGINSIRPGGLGRHQRE